MKRALLLLLLPILAWTSLQAQTTRDEVYADITRTGGIYHAYPVAEATHQTPAPQGYAPFYISHFGRHGSRWLISEAEYLDVLGVLDSASLAGKLTPLGEDVRQRVETIWKDAEGRTGDLTALGAAQQRGIARRMYAAYPEVFAGKGRIVSRSTPVVRCVLSMSAFDRALQGLNPALEISEESSKRYLCYMTPRSEEIDQWRRDRSAAWREEHRRFAEEHVHPERLTGLLFNDAAYVDSSIDARDFMQDLFRVASSVQNTGLEVTLYDLFEPEELFDLWQTGNLYRYLDYGPSAASEGLVIGNASPLLRNFVETADRAIGAGEPAATLRFGHDVDLMPLVALMGLDDMGNQTSDPAEAYRLWSDFIVSPMGANVQWIFFRNPKNGDILVKFLHNEREKLLPIPSETAPYYRWDEARDFFRSRLVD